jgi:hypothetical protein
MEIEQWDKVLSLLADDPADYEREGNVATFVRQGRESLLSFREVPTAGLCIQKDGPPASGGNTIPVATFIQRDLLGLPRLAAQLVRTLERGQQGRPGRFVEGPASFLGEKDLEHWAKCGLELRKFLVQAEAGTTRVLQLMAPAGQGKTMLLENVAISLARAYQPDPFPTPILLPVDLLGRYVGTIDDAIAGSLNNTYLFPGLTQRDVNLAVQHRWLILALDGFDELVARVGVRDAFRRITDLLDQLDGSGTVILSARGSFFDLFQISSAIRTYLQPRRGAYTTATLQLLGWNDEQGVEFFDGLGSPSPEQDLRGLLAAFEQDREIVLQPFFLSRLAKLWSKGERFDGAGGLPSPIARAKFVIERFIERESVEKWVDREGHPILLPGAHSEMLSTIAEEMWRSGAFRLDAEELRIAGELGLSQLAIAREAVAEAVNKLPTHAALSVRDGQYAFVHDQFLYHFLAHRIAHLLSAEDLYSLREIFRARELSPPIVDWVVWAYCTRGCEMSTALKSLSAVRQGQADPTLDSNAARVCAALLAHAEPNRAVEVVGYTFVGDVFKDRVYTRLTFRNCRFWHLDLSSTRLSDCRFQSCALGDIMVDEATSLRSCVFEDSSIDRVETPELGTFFAPRDVERALCRLGAQFVGPAPVAVTEQAPIAGSEAIQIAERFVRASARTCDVAVEEMESRFGHEAQVVARIGVESGVFKEVSKGVSGPRRTFVRFAVDRDRLLEGQLGPTGDSIVDRFWAAVAKRFPPGT